MEDIVKDFLDEVNDIKNSSLFMEDDENEPTTEWVEEIDSRTNFPFYWNSNTKESVWDKPESYDVYLNDYECYLRGIVEQHCITKAKELHENNLKKQSDMRDLLGYSDSEEECEKECEKEEMVEEAIIVTEPPEPEESAICKKERWMGEQVVLATQYLNNIVKSMSETALMKVKALAKEFPNGETMIPIGLQVQTRLEDWEGGYLTVERTVEKLKDALMTVSKFEGDLEFNSWKLHWDGEKTKYYFANIHTGEKKWTLSNGKCNHEDGEIVEDEDDLTLDLHEYVNSTLQPSLLDEDVAPELMITESDGEQEPVAVNVEGLAVDARSPVMKDKEGIPKEDTHFYPREDIEILGLEEFGKLADEKEPPVVRSVNGVLEDSTVMYNEKVRKEDTQCDIVVDVELQGIVDEEEGIKLNSEIPATENQEEDMHECSNEKTSSIAEQIIGVTEDEEDNMIEDEEEDHMSEESEKCTAESTKEDAEEDMIEDTDEHLMEDVKENIIEEEALKEKILEELKEDMIDGTIKGIGEEVVEDTVEDGSQTGTKEEVVECTEGGTAVVREDDSYDNTEELMLKYAEEFRKEEAKRLATKQDEENLPTKSSPKVIHCDFMALVDYPEEDMSGDSDAINDL